MKDGCGLSRCTPQHGWRVALRVTALLLLVTTQPALSAMEVWTPPSAWRIGPGVAAPWVPAQSHTPPAKEIAGQSLRFMASDVVGPPPLACARAGYVFLVLPAEGMFQGNLPPPADAVARTLGVQQLPVLNMRVSCESGLFDYHLISPDRMLLGLDNILWTLTRTAPDDSPESAVLELMGAHLSHDMRFDAASVAHKQAHLTRDLQNLITGYFHRPLPAGEVPPIDGDPFTDSQEHPAHFALGRARIDGMRATVPVQWQNDSHRWIVEVLLLKENGRWKVDDLHYGRAESLRAQLMRNNE